MRHPLRRVLGAGLLLLGLVACDSGSGFSEPVPSLVAARADGERLEVWTGTPCEEVTRIELILDPGARDPLAEIEYVAREPQTVDRFDLAAPPTGFTARTPLPDGLSWRDAEALLVVLTLADGERSVRVDLARLAEVADAGDAGSDYLLGQDVLTEDEVVAGDGDDYALVCSPDPTAG